MSSLNHSKVLTMSDLLKHPRQLLPRLNDLHGEADGGELVVVAAMVDY
jgi:hypothetical protein